MAARHTTVTVPAGDWTELSNGVDITALTFQVVAGGAVWIKGTTNSTKPAVPANGVPADGANLYSVADGEKKLTLTDIWPGITAVRVWACPMHNSTPSSVFVSHA